MTEVAYVYLLPKVLTMLDDVPGDDRPKSEADFWKAVAVELAELIRHGAQAKQPEIVMSKMRQAGTQYIWEFWVNDLSLSKEARYNWHGQNASQWKYAGAILLHNGEISKHH